MILHRLAVTQVHRSVVDLFSDHQLGLLFGYLVIFIAHGIKLNADPIINCDYNNACEYARSDPDIDLKGTVSNPIDLSFLYICSQLQRSLVFQLQLCRLFLQWHLQHRHFIRLEHLSQPLLRS